MEISDDEWEDKIKKNMELTEKLGEIFEGYDTGVVLACTNRMLIMVAIHLGIPKELYLKLVGLSWEDGKEIIERSKENE